MMDTFDVILVDLQDLGCRIYTFITTLRYIWKRRRNIGKPCGTGSAQSGRPAVRSLTREKAGKLCRRRPVTDGHGLTLGDWVCWLSGRSARCRISHHRDAGLAADAAPGFGWPLGERTWVNPVPMSKFMDGRALCGTVMLESTTLS